MLGVFKDTFEFYILISIYRKINTKCTLVSRDCVPFCKYIKRHVYPGKTRVHISNSTRSTYAIKQTPSYGRGNNIDRARLTDNKLFESLLQGELFPLLLLHFARLLNKLFPVLCQVALDGWLARVIKRCFAVVVGFQRICAGL